MTALIHLAQAPDAAIDEVVERCSRGEKLIIAEVDGVIQRHGGRPLPKPPGKAKAKQSRPSPRVRKANDALTGLSNEGTALKLIPHIIDGMFVLMQIFSRTPRNVSMKAVPFRRKGSNRMCAKLHDDSRTVWNRRPNSGPTRLRSSPTKRSCTVTHIRPGVGR